MKGLFEDIGSCLLDLFYALFLIYLLLAKGGLEFPYLTEEEHVEPASIF